jgi:hypothetical protein
LVILGTPANADHVVIGPAGVVLVDSTRDTGRVWQGPDGRVWHTSNSWTTGCVPCGWSVPRSPACWGCRCARWCVHGAHVNVAGLSAGDIDLLPAGRLVGVLTVAGQRLSSADVAALAAAATGTAPGGPGSLVSRPDRGRQRLVRELGPNAHGQLPHPGRVADCYLALPSRHTVRTALGGCWWSRPGAA